MKRSKNQLEIIELPDCVISYIFSKLRLKDLVKTSTLSKRWLHELGLRTDLNFDIQNLFDHNNTIQDLQQNLPLFQSQFATRLNQFMLRYQGAIIRSIRVKFPLCDQQSYAIDTLICQGIAKGVNRIELLFSYETDLAIEPYQFHFALLSDTESLMHLHLQNCRLVASIDFTEIKNLRTLVLHLVSLDQDILQRLFFNCTRLVDFTLDDCDFNSDLKIISPTLFYLNIVNCRVKNERNIDIIASNLTSIEYSYNDECYLQHSMNIEAHMLSKFSFRGCNFYEWVRFSGLKNVTTIVLDGLLYANIVPRLFSECLQLEDVTFRNCKIMLDLKIISPKLHHLKLIDCGHMNLPPKCVDIHALNLSSFEYSCHTGELFTIKAPRLLKVFWDAAKREENPHPFGPIARLRHIENLAMILSPSQIANLTWTVLVRFQNLRQLELYIEGTYDPNMNYFSILDIAMASPHLQKLSLTIRNPHPENSHMVGFERQREYTSFCHNNLKYVKLCGCVCTINVIELANHLLKNVSSLKQITFSSRDKFYIGGERWTEGSENCCWPERNFIHEMLKDELNEQCRLIIL